MPPTTGGKTIGRTTSARSTLRPGKTPRASTHASGTPTSSEIPVAASETSTDNRSAVTAPTPRSVSASRPHGARTNKARTGRTTNPAPSAASATTGRGRRVRTRSAARWSEPELFQDVLSLGATDVVDEHPRLIRVAAPRHGRDRIGGHHVHVVRDV